MTTITRPTRSTRTTTSTRLGKTLLLPAKLALEMLSKAANGVYTRAVERIDAQMDAERLAAWERYCSELDAIAERARRAKVPHRNQYIRSIAHAQTTYYYALRDIEADLRGATHG